MQKLSAVINMYNKNSSSDKKSKKVLTESNFEGSPLKKNRTRKRPQKKMEKKYNGIIEPIFNY